MAELAALSLTASSGRLRECETAQRSTDDSSTYCCVQMSGTARVTRKRGCQSNNLIFAGVAELADALDLGSSVTHVQVQVLSPAPKQYNPNQIFPVGDGFGLFVYFEKYENVYFRNGVLIRPESKPRGPRKKKRL